MAPVTTLSAMWYLSLSSHMFTSLCCHIGRRLYRPIAIAAKPGTLSVDCLMLGVEVSGLRINLRNSTVWIAVAEHGSYS